LRQKLDLLFRELGLTQENTGDIATGLREALHIPPHNRIVVVGHEHGRSGSARPHAGLQRGFRTKGDKNVGTGAHHRLCLLGHNGHILI
jgi:hypothetical protein